MNQMNRLPEQVDCLHSERYAQPEIIHYKQVVSASLRMLIVKPKGWSKRDKRTAIVWIHGGGWSSGQPELFLPHGRFMADHGAVSISIQYRLLHSEKGLPSEAVEASRIHDCLEDCQDAVSYVRTHAKELGIDSERIVAAGDSAGGHLAACLGTQASKDPRLEGSLVNAMVNCNGIMDMTGEWRAFLPSTIDDPDLDQVESWMSGRELAMTMSPLFRVRPEQPPMLTIHGLKDGTVVPEQAVRFHEAQQACGNQSKLVLLPESKHAFILFDYTATLDETMNALEEIALFLEEINFLRGTGIVTNNG